MKITIEIPDEEIKDAVLMTGVMLTEWFLNVFGK